MKVKDFEFLSKVVFFGAIWGIGEATIGYLLHLLPGYLAGSLMFPFVVFVLYRAYKSLGSKKAIFYVAIIAMMIKSVNLLLPFMPPAKTINPMVSMFLESLLVFAIIPLFESDKIINKVGAIFIASIGWRLAFVGYQGINYLVTDYLALYLRDFSAAFEYVVTLGLISAGFASLVMLVSLRLKQLDKLNSVRINPIVSLATLVIAIILTLVI